MAHLRHDARTNLEGTTALGLVKTVNLKTEAFKADMSLFNTADIQYPFITHVFKQGELLHYYVVLKNTKNYLVIVDPDPDVGVVKMTKEKFAQEWTGIVLFMVPDDEFEPVKEKKRNLWSLFPYMFKQKWQVHLDEKKDIAHLMPEIKAKDELQIVSYLPVNKIGSIKKGQAIHMSLPNSSETTDRLSGKVATVGVYPVNIHGASVYEVICKMKVPSR